jgi:transposase
VLHCNLIPRCPAADLFGHKGRTWLAAQDLPADERQAVTGLLRQLDFFGEELRAIDRQFGAEALARPEVRRLMTIPGVDATVALSIVAAIGDFHRFPSPDKLVAYLGLNPRVRQSASHGRITKQGRAHARGMLVEAAWVAVKARDRYAHSSPASGPGAVCRSRSSPPPASSPCCAGNLIVHDTDYAFARPSLIAQKQRALELRAGLPARRGQRGSAAAYNSKSVRRRERQLAEQAETAYQTLIAQWQPKPSTITSRTGGAASTEARLSQPTQG